MSDFRFDFICKVWLNSVLSPKGVLVSNLRYPYAVQYANGKFEYFEYRSTAEIVAARLKGDRKNRIWVHDNGSWNKIRVK